MHGGVFVVFWHDFEVIFLPLNLIFSCESSSISQFGGRMVVGWLVGRMVGRLVTAS